MRIQEWGVLQKIGQREKDTYIEVRLSSIQFPEMCPVCLKSPPEDLVSVTIVERPAYTRHLEDVVAFAARDEIDLALTTSSSTVTLWIPTCMRHGSKSLRTTRTKIIPAIAFFVLFYPILYFMMGTNIAYTTQGDLIQPLSMLIVCLIVMTVACIYGAFPRAIERKIRFIGINRVKDQVIVGISNRIYADRFLEINTVSSGSEKQ